MADECRVPDENECASCGVELRDEERGMPVCRVCDFRLDAEIRAWMDLVQAYRDFVAVCQPE